MIRILTACIIIFSLPTLSEVLPDDKKNQKIFDDALSYNQKMIEIDKIVQNQTQAILRGDYGQSKERKIALLKKLNERAKIVGTGRTIKMRQPLVDYLQTLGGELGAGKLPLNRDGSVNEDFKGRNSDYDLKCKPSACQKIQDDLIKSGKFKIRQTANGTFDIVANNGSGEDMIKITFNVDDPDLEVVSRSDSVGNKERYTAIQLEEKYGKYQGNKSIDQALKAKDHAFKGDLLSHDELMCFSNACDEAFNTSTKTARKLIKDAPNFINDADIEKIIERNGLRRDDGAPMKAEEYKRMLEQSYSGKSGKAMISLQVNNMDKFISVRNMIVKETVNRIEVAQSDLFTSEVKDLEDRLKSGEINQKQYNSRRAHLNEINENLLEYSNNSKYRSISETNVENGITSKQIKDQYSSRSKVTKKSLSGMIDVAGKYNQKLTKQLNTSSVKAGKGFERLNTAGAVIGVYDTGKMIVEHCGDPEVCSEVLSSIGKEVAKEAIIDSFISRGIPVYGQLKEAYEAGYFVGEAIEEHILGIKVKDCRVIEGEEGGSDRVQNCKEVTIRNKWIQDPLKKQMDSMNGTMEQEKSADFMIQASKICKDYTKEMERRNLSCFDIAKKYETDLLKNETNLTLLEGELLEIAIEVDDEDRENKKQMVDVLGCDISIDECVDYASDSKPIIKDEKKSFNPFDEGDMNEFLTQSEKESEERLANYGYKLTEDGEVVALDEMDSDTISEEQLLQAMQESEEILDNLGFKNTEDAEAEESSLELENMGTFITESKDSFGTDSEENTEDFYDDFLDETEPISDDNERIAREEAERVAIERERQRIQERLAREERSAIEETERLEAERLRRAMAGLPKHDPNWGEDELAREERIAREKAEKEKAEKLEIMRALQLFNEKNDLLLNVIRKIEEETMIGALNHLHKTMCTREGKVDTDCLNDNPPTIEYLNPGCRNYLTQKIFPDFRKGFVSGFTEDDMKYVYNEVKYDNETFNHDIDTAFERYVFGVIKRNFQNAAWRASQPNDFVMCGCGPLAWKGWLEAGLFDNAFSVIYWPVEERSKKLCPIDW